MNIPQSEMLRVHATSPESSAIERAATLLRAGELVAFPTETVYGLGADALQPQAVERIFHAKGRPFSDPLIVHIALQEDLKRLTSSVSPLAQKLIDAFWPGPLTLLFPASSSVPKQVTAGLPTVAVRMPRHAVALAVIRAVASPIAAPSANRFMHVSPTTAEHVHSDLAGRVPLILDAGPCTVGIESTILDLSTAIPKILRPGGVSVEALRTLVPEVQVPPQRHTTHPEQSPVSLVQQAPGQLPVHYAPSVPSILFEGTKEAMYTAMLAAIRRSREQGERVGVLIADEDSEVFQDSGALLYTLGNSAIPEELAAHLFAGLRFLEASGVQVILCRSFSEQGLGLALQDRLLKATGGNVQR